MFDFVSKRRWFFLGSAIIIIAGLISIFLPGGLKLGTDFKSGSSLIVRFSPGEVTKDQVVGVLSDNGYADATVQESKGTQNGTAYAEFTIRTRPMSPEVTNTVEQNLTSISSSYNNYPNPISSGTVTPVVAAQTVRNAIIAVAIATLGILLYMAWAFRKMPSPFRYGTCAIVSLIHDLLVVLAVFSLFGRVFNLEINVYFITACLAILGYSVNDTVVVFDRIRENVGRGITPDFTINVNRSLTETLTRSLNTTLTTLLACLAMYLFVGGPISGFMLALLVGFASGSYSSFLASYLLVVWERRGMEPVSAPNTSA